MKLVNIILIALVIMLMVSVVMYRPPPEKYVAGRLYIRERGISAEVYTHQEDPLDGMSSLWNGGKVITREDLSTVQVGDMAELYTVEGEHLVLECIDIRQGLALLMEPHGDVIVINGKWLYRLTRL